MKVQAKIQILIEERKTNRLNYLSSCLVELKTTTKEKKEIVKEFKNVFMGNDVEQIIDSVVDYFFSIFIKPTSLEIETNNKDLLLRFLDENINLPKAFSIEKVIFKNKIDKKVLNDLRKISKEFLETNTKNSIPNYLLYSYDDILINLNGKEANMQLALYLKMVANYFNAHPEHLIDDLPIYLSMKEKKVLPSEQIVTVEDFISYFLS